MWFSLPFLVMLMDLMHLHFYLSLEKRSSGRAILDLSTNSLSPKTCAVLGKALAADRTFVEIKFSDCMLAEDGEFGLRVQWS